MLFFSLKFVVEHLPNNSIRTIKKAESLAEMLVKTKMERDYAMKKIVTSSETATNKTLYYLYPRIMSLPQYIRRADSIFGDYLDLIDERINI